MMPALSAAQSSASKAALRRKFHALALKHRSCSWCLDTAVLAECCIQHLPDLDAVLRRYHHHQQQQQQLEVL
jgi:hypothetical protein